MKTYKEMTQSVLEQAAHRRSKRNRLTAIAASASVLAVVLMAAIGIGSAQSRSAPDRAPRLVLMCSASEYTEHEEVAAGVVTPLKFFIRVHDLRNIGQDKKWLEIMSQEAAFREETWNEETQDGTKPDNKYMRWQNEDVMISLLYKGFLYLTVENYDTVQSMSATTTDAGFASVVRYSHRGADGEAVEGISIEWSLSDLTVEKLQEDPTMKLSTISDTIRVKVGFRDGTTEIVVIELTVDDNGNVYATNKGTITDA